MNKFLMMSLCLAFLSLSSVPQTSGTLTLAAITIPTITFTSGTATTLAALGLIKLKAAALLSLRSRRQAEEIETNAISVDQEILWTAVAKMEDNHKCVRRFLCEVGTGKLAAADYTPVIKELLSTSLEVSVDSTKEPYARAAKRGATHHNPAKCQADYICQFTGEEIYKKLNLFGA